MAVSQSDNCPYCGGLGWMIAAKPNGLGLPLFGHKMLCPRCTPAKVKAIVGPQYAQVEWERSLSVLDPYKICGMEGADVFYIPLFLGKKDSKDLMDALMYQIGAMFPEQGKRDHRQTLWFGEKDYTYSGHTHQAHPIEGALKHIFDEVVDKFRLPFNGVLINLYVDGKVKISPHSDSEDDIIPNSPILSLSLGASRTFKMKKKTPGSEWEKEWLLGPGDVLIMAGSTQQFWLHQVPRESSVKEPRLNLTFRVIK